ncbi:hypothetical protein [Trichloromonas sp.]|uniref:hypothetical protein n=1 Tax=Trichloromonas sp. TaxID=3069249 RepID=UPI003D8165DF
MTEKMDLMERVIVGVVMDDKFREWALGSPKSVQEIFGISDKQAETLKQLNEIDPAQIRKLGRSVKDPKAFAAGIAASADLIKDIGVAASYY